MNAIWPENTDNAQIFPFAVFVMVLSIFMQQKHIFALNLSSSLLQVVAILVYRLPMESRKSDLCHQAKKRQQNSCLGFKVSWWGKEVGKELSLGEGGLSW